MTNACIKLKLTAKELLSHNEAIFQTDDGTVYHWKGTCPQRLFVKLTSFFRTQDIDAVLPGYIEFPEAIGNDIYFLFDNQKQVYKASVTQSRGIAVSYVRDEIEGAKFHCGGLRSRISEFRTFVYRMCDDPETDGIFVNITKEKLDNLYLRGIHRGAAVYVSKNPGAPCAQKLLANVIVVDMPMDYSDLYARESSQFIYISLLNNVIHVLPTVTMDFLLPLEFEGVDQINKITRIHNGQISALVKIGDDQFLVTAQLPGRYYEDIEPPRVLATSNIKAAKKCEDIERPRDLATSSIKFVKKEEEPENEIQVTPANNILDSVLDQCSCSICSENFDSEKFIPRNLDCGHSFCEVCINNDKMRIGENIKCPNCSALTPLHQGRVLSKSFALISLSEQLMKSRVDPKVTCKACELKFSTSSVCVCMKEDCTMFNQLICLNCTIDGGHGGHVVKYDAMMKKIREELRHEVNDICSQVEAKKNTVLEKTEQLTELFTSIKKTLGKSEIPSQVLMQMDTVASEQEATDYKEIVKDLAKTIIDQCDSLIESFDAALTSAHGLALLEDTGN